MNLVQIGTNEFFPNSPLLNSRESSTTTQDRRCSHLSNPPFTQRASLVRPSFPNLLAGFDPNHALFQLQTTNYDVQSPYAMQFNLSIQRALPGDWDVFVGYVGSRGKNLLRIGDTVVIQKAGEIIPQVVRVQVDSRDRTKGESGRGGGIAGGEHGDAACTISQGQQEES